MKKISNILMLIIIAIFLYACNKNDTSENNEIKKVDIKINTQEQELPKITIKESENKRKIIVVDGKDIEPDDFIKEYCGFKRDTPICQEVISAAQHNDTRSKRPMLRF